jgi:hypothetical protein
MCLLLQKINICSETLVLNLNQSWTGGLSDVNIEDILSPYRVWIKLQLSLPSKVKENVTIESSG